MKGGWININKPEGISSAHLLNKLKRFFPKKTRVGHAGTLDQYACGVLPVAVGFATKLIPDIMEAEKAYTFTVCWGAFTTTGDRDGDVIETCSKIPMQDEINHILPSFLGIQNQVPPSYSALKINGKRASDLMRKGEIVELAPRQITLFELNHIENSDQHSTFFVRCSKGTYVRSLAVDIAKALGTAGYVTYLRRDRVGNFIVENAYSLEDNLIFSKLHEVHPNIPILEIGEFEIKELSFGRSVPLLFSDKSRVLLKYKDDVVALGKVENNVFIPNNVFHVI